MNAAIPIVPNGETIQKSAVEKRFDEEMGAAVTAATADDAAATTAIVSGTEAVCVCTISPGSAALIFRNHNGLNRDLSIPKVRDYQAAMERGEWKETHQGYAFDPKGRTVDGQHRLAAQALAKTTLKMHVSRNIERSIIDAIDLAKPRKAYEALHIAGISNAGEKERIARAAMEYTSRVEKDPTKPTLIQVEKYVTNHDDALSLAIERGRQSAVNIAEPCMSQTQASQMAFLLYLGKWPDSFIPDFLKTLQSGVEQKENGVIVPAARIMIAAKRRDKKTDALTRDQLIATVLRAAGHFLRGESVARFKPAKKTEFVDYRAADPLDPLPLAA
jgi:hypothetical protein